MSFDLELVLRLASVLWRLRRATLIETGLFEIQAPDPRDPLRLLPKSRATVHAIFDRPAAGAPADSLSMMERGPDSEKAQASAVEFARCFLRLANLPNFALDRLSRYESNLWRQASQILYALETLDRRKPQERTRRYWLVSEAGMDRE